MYAGQNFGATQSYKTNLNQYAIGVFDSTKNKVKIIQCNHVYRMDQHVRALDGMDVTKPSESNDTFQTKQRVLADTFGSKKTQKRLASRAANEVTVQESTSQVLTHAVGTIQPNQMEAEDSLLDTIHQTVLPRYDEYAESVRDIYLPSSVLPGHVSDALGPLLKVWRAIVKKGVDKVKKDFKSETPLTKSHFVENRLEALAALEKGDDRDDVLRLVIYLDLLLSFRNGGKNKKKIVQDWIVKEDGSGKEVPDIVKDHMLNEFTSMTLGADGANRSTFDGKNEQKLLCHIAVTTILLCNFVLDASQIDAMSTDLHMMTSDMLKYYSEAGCSVSKSRIALTAPLKLPKLRKKIERK